MMAALFSGLLVRIPLLLAYLAGAIAALVLAIRQRSGATYLALVGFTLLLFFGLLASIFSLAPFWFADAGMPMARVATLVGLITLVLNLGSTAGIVCLILALWRGLRPPV